MNMLRFPFHHLRPSTSPRPVLAVVAAMGLSLAGSVHAAISVGAGGVGPLTFATQPTVADGWSTIVVGGSSVDITTAPQLDAAAATNVASAMTTALPATATTAPSISPSGVPRWNSTLQLLQSVSTSAGYVALLATLQNDSGGDLTQVRVSYTLNELHAAGTTVAEEIPGQRVYWSLTGEAGSWQVIPSFSSVGSPGTLTAVIQPGLWANGTPLYLLWADDNATAARDNAGTEDGGYTIDNFAVSLSTEGVTITSPADGQTLVQGSAITINVDATLPGMVQNVQFRANGTSIGNDNSSPFSFSWVGAPLGTNLLTAVASDNLGNVRTSAVVRVIVAPNQPATVTLVTPVAFEYITARSVALWATATDADGSVAQVQFYRGTTLVGTDTTGSPYSVVASNLPAGTHVLTAVATDNAGLASTSAPVTVRVVLPPANLVPFGASWRYLDTGVDAGGAGVFGSWTDFVYDDSGWSNGIAEFGYGDADESTLVRFGPDANNKYITTYFRRLFTVGDPNGISSLGLRLRVDDGVVVYLNNQVLVSYNMPAGPGFQTLASAGAEDDPVIGTNITVDGLGVFLLNENILAVEVHQSATNSSDMSFDLELTANPANVPPVVTINLPEPSGLYVGGQNIPFNISSYDLDGGITGMEVRANGGTFFTAAQSQVAFTAFADPGIYRIDAIVTDNSGLTATSTLDIFVRAAPVDVLLIPTNSVWSYLDDGSNQGTAWRQLNFPAADSWLSGPAELGYGDGDETTVVNFGPDPNNKFITTYFRRKFNVASTNGFTNVQVRLRRDDGAVVYVNGTEVQRSNLPLGPITSTTLAGADTDDGEAIHTANFSPALLVAGDNVVAVEVHQNSVASSDVTFELELVGQYPPPALAVRLDTVDPTLLHLSWAPALPGYVLEESTSLTGPWATSANQSNPQTVTFDLSDPPRYYRLVAP